MSSYGITQHAQSWVHLGELNPHNTLKRHVPQQLYLPEEAPTAQRGQRAGEVVINPAPDVDTPLYSDKTNQPGVSIACHSFRKGPHTSLPGFLS